MAVCALICLCSIALIQIIIFGVSPWLSGLFAGLPALGYLSAFVLCVVVLFSPAFLLRLGWGRKESAQRLVADGFLIWLLLGYTSFSVYLVAGPAIGRVFVWVLWWGSVAFGLYGIRRNHRSIRDFRGLPWAIYLLVGLLYLSILTYSPINLDLFTLPQFRFLPNGLPNDNVIPWYWMEALLAGEVPHPLHGDWLSSDRPPLQTAVISGAFQILVPAFNADLVYLSISLACQILWIPTAWLVLSEMGANRREISYAVFLSAVTGFFCLNSLYVWPKLLAASLTLLAIYFLLSEVDIRAAWVKASVATAFSLLAHGGAFFALPLIGVIAFLRFRERNFLKGLGYAVCAGLLFLLPWVLYQRFWDPPGDRLLKWHFAGVISIDSRSFLQAIHDSYSNLTFANWLSRRSENIAWLFGSFPTSLEKLRDGQFFHLFQSLGFLNLGFLGYLFNRESSSFRSSKPIWWGLFLSLLGWNLLLFEGRSTSIHQGPYAIFAMLYLIASVGVSKMPTFLRYLVCILHLILFAFIWWHPLDYTLALPLAAVPNFATGTASVLSLLGLLFFLSRWNRVSKNL